MADEAPAEIDDVPPAATTAEAPASSRDGDRASSVTRWQTTFLAVIAVALVVSVGYSARDLLLPIFLAIYLAILLAPLVRRLRRWRVPEVAGAGLVTLAFIAICVGGGYYLATPFQEWIERGAYLPYKAEQRIGELRESAEKAAETVEQIAKKASGEDSAQGASGSPAAQPEDPKLPFAARDVSEYLLGTVTTMTLTFVSLSVLLYFLLAFGRRMVTSFVAGFRDPHLARRTDAFVGDVSGQIARYFQVVTLINIGLGVVAGVVLQLLDMPNPIFWGFVVGLLNYLPFVGPTISILAIAVAAFLSYDSWLHIALPPLAVLLLNGLEAQFVTPTLVGKRLELNPFAVILSIMIGAWVWGLIGAILAVPTLATVRLGLAHFDVLRPVHQALR